MAVDSSSFHGVVYTEVLGLSDTASALNEIAKKFPDTFKRAMGAEVMNLKRSIAATLKNYKILKAVPVPNLIEATSYRGFKLAKKSPITKLLRGPKHVSKLANPGSVKIESIQNGFEIGHFGGLSRYAVKFQEGVPRHIDSKETRRWMYIKLGSKKNVHDYTTLSGIISPVSPEREYISVLADKCRRDFVPGLVKCLEKIASGEMKKANKARK